MSQLPPAPQRPPVRSVAPLTLHYATSPLPRVDLRKIATRQRAVICCILASVPVAMGGLAIPDGPFGVRLAQAQALLQVILLIAGLVFAFMLSLAVYRDPATGVIGGLLLLVPLVNLFILVVINLDAIKIFRRHRVRVGLLGAESPPAPAAGAGANALR